MHAQARDAFEHLLDSAGARAVGNAYAASAASPALYHACAERTQVCPFALLYHTLGDDTCNHKPPKHLRPLLASTGQMPHTISAYKPLAPRAGSFCASNTGLQRSMRGSRACTRASTAHLLRCVWRSIKGRLCPHCAQMISSCSFPSIRSPWQVPRSIYPEPGHR